MEQSGSHRQGGRNMQHCLPVARRCTAHSIGRLQTRCSRYRRLLGRKEYAHPCNEEGKALPTYPSSFDESIALTQTVTAEEFLDNEWEAVYQLVNADLAAAVGDNIYKFKFSYRGGTNLNDGYLINTPGGLFLFAGEKQEFSFVTLADQTIIDETDEEVKEEIDDLDFSMF